MNFDGWIIYNQNDAKRNESYIKWMLEESEAFPFSLKLYVKEDLQYGIENNQFYIKYLNQDITLPHFVIMRNVNPLFSKHLEAMGIRVFNSAKIAEMCNNKAITHQEIAKIGINMVNTVFVKKSEFTTEQIPFSYPLVIKEVNGRGGQQVNLIENENKLLTYFMEVHSEDFIVQPLVNDLGKDVRVFVIGRDIIAAILRESKNSFKSNFSLGGQASIYHLNNKEKEIIEKIINHFSFDFVGIDFIVGNNGEFLFNEIEDVVGSRTLSLNTNINIVHLYFDHIKKTLGV